MKNLSWRRRQQCDCSHSENGTQSLWIISCRLTHTSSWFFHRQSGNSCLFRWLRKLWPNFTADMITFEVAWPVKGWPFWLDSHVKFCGCLQAEVSNRNCHPLMVITWRSCGSSLSATHLRASSWESPADGITKWMWLNRNTEKWAY